MTETPRPGAPGWYRVGSSFYRVGTGPHSDWRFPAELSPIGWDSPEGGRGPVRSKKTREEAGPLVVEVDPIGSELDREIEEARRVVVDLPGQLMFEELRRFEITAAEPTPEEEDVVRLVVRKSRRYATGPASGQLSFLDGSRGVEFEGSAPTPRRRRSK